MDAQEDMERELGWSSHEAPRGRGKLIECWYKKPVVAKKMRGGMWHGDVYDGSPAMWRDVADGTATLAERPSMEVRVALMTLRGVMVDAASPYRFNQFPFIPVWGYRDGRTQLPYGMVPDVRDIQNDVNKRASKALHILNTNKVVMDDGAVANLDEFAREAARPDGILVKRPGAFLELGADRDLAPAHLV